MTKEQQHRNNILNALKDAGIENGEVILGENGSLHNLKGFNLTFTYSDGTGNKAVMEGMVFEISRTAVSIVLYPPLTASKINRFVFTHQFSADGWVGKDENGAKHRGKLELQMPITIRRP